VEATKVVMMMVEMILMGMAALEVLETVQEEEEALEEVVKVEEEVKVAEAATLRTRSLL
jgi:hypothetical protein